MRVTHRKEAVTAPEIAGEPLFVKHRKELTSSGFGSPLELSAGAGGVLKKMPLDTALRFVVFSGGSGEGPRTFR